MSEIRATTISDAAGTGPITLTAQSAAKAWARYDGSAPTLNESFNVSSLNDDGSGDQTLTFTTAMSSTNFVFAGHSNQYHTGNDNVASSSTVNTFTANSSHVKTDATRVGITIHGDLA